MRRKMSNLPEGMTQQDFDEILSDIAYPGDVPGVYELVANHYRDDVIAEWLANQEDDD